MHALLVTNDIHPKSRGEAICGCFLLPCAFHVVNCSSNYWSFSLVNVLPFVSRFKDCIEGTLLFFFQELVTQHGIATEIGA